MLFIFPTPQYPRKPIEYVFKSIYLASNTLHMLALSVLIADFYTRMGSSMPEYFTNSDLIIADGIKTVLSDCTYTGELRLQSVRGQVDVSLGSVPYYLMTTAQYVTALFVVEFLLIINNGLCMLMYSSGNRHMRAFGIHVPLYTILCCFSYFYCIALIVITWSFEGNRQFFKHGLEFCANALRRANPDAFYESEFDGTTIFTTAVYWPFAAACCSLVVYFVAAVVLACHAYDKASILLSEADAPWEARGVMCTTSKPLLKLHTAQRNAIVDDARKAIEQGQSVRIVRSYQLMTEEDFEALVSAMREQVAKLLKEKQFMKLKENFGDTESQIDQGGLVWRAQMMPQPLEGGDDGPADGDEMYGGATPSQVGQNGEAFYDVDFGEYFDDNNAERRGGPGGARFAPQTAAGASAAPQGVDGRLYPDEPYDNNNNADLGFYDDAVNANDEYDDDADFGGDRFPDADFHDLDGDGTRGGGGDPASSGRRSHRHHRHHRSTSRQGERSRRRNRGDVGDYLEEPDPRRPIAAPLFDDDFGPGDAFSPAENAYSADNGADALSDDFEL